MPLVLNRPLVLVGVGNMGGALLKGWLAGGLDPKLVVVLDPSPPESMRAMLAASGIACQAKPPALSSPPAAVVLAVKPQLMDEVAPTVAALVSAKTVVLSVAAGRTVASLARYFPPGTAIVRSMPNTPAAVGRGITVAIANAAVSAPQKALCDSLLAAVGEVAWVEREGLIDAATAVSGSGPAYVFLLAECLAEAGRAVGLPGDLAARLARATVGGSGELLHRSELSPAVLRQNVTSPKGTTAAALEVLMAPEGLQKLLTAAVAAAEARAKALAV
jgi:pyrroline-5-carboxylate reductase